MIKSDEQTDIVTLLIVDDNEEILDFLSDDLSEQYMVLKAADGINALEILKNNPVQLIISDVMMEPLDGFELCQQVKTNFECSHIPIILLTAKNTLQSKIEGLEAGADAYIEKPFSPAYLNAQISSLLNNRKKLKEYFVKSPLAHIKTMAHSKMDELFLENLNQLIEEKLEDVSLDVEHLALHMNMSRPTLYRKIKSISNLSPNEMINITRLKKAAALISLGNTHMSEIAEKVGYSSLTQFDRNFKKEFNMTPSEYTRKVLHV